MNKKPVILRSLFALLVLGVFIFSMFPFGQKDYFETLNGMMTDPKDPGYQKIVEKARAKIAKTPGMYASAAIEQAASETEEELALKDPKFQDRGKLLKKYVKPVIVKAQKIANNRDVIANARRLSAGSIRLGIDLNGGAEFLLELKPAEQGSAADSEKKIKDIQDNYERYRDIAIENLRRRIEGLNIFESEISPAGGQFISLRVPTVSKEEKAKLENLIKMSARLSFNLVHPQNAELVKAYLADPKGFKVPSGYKLMHSVEGSRNRGDNLYFVEREARMDGKNIVNAYTNLTQFGQREILLSFNHAGAIQFGEVTSHNVGRQMAIILDGNLYSAPVIQTAITGGNAQITGDFSREDAENISNALVSGSVPFKVNVLAQYDIEPTIGKETVRDGLWSGIAGMILVMVFMLLYYRRAGIVADISLLLNGVIMLGAIAAFGVTLTLPGIAGMILTIGMAVDANVLIYERMREEASAGKPIHTVVDLGFGKAFSAIFDSNVTTLFVALILLWQGTGAIKGFAMTLAIGIFTTMFTAVFVTHILFDLMMRYLPFERLPMGHLIKQTHFNFLKYRWVAIIFSGVLLIASVATFAIRGKSVLGVDFTGGTQIELNYREMVPAEKIAKSLTQAGYDVKVTYKTPGSMADTRQKLEILCRTSHKGKVAQTASGKEVMTHVSSVLNRDFPKAQFSGARQSTLGALIGWTFTKSAIISLTLAVIGMILYMTLRFQFAYSVAANIAVIHDVIIAMGLFALCGGEITLNTVAAALTILGYSINDTIVNFDRVRENLAVLKGKTFSYSEVINRSVNQMLARTIFTSVTTLLVLVMQLCFGGASIRDFVSVMTIGVIIGCYSSIWISTIIIDVWHRKTNSELRDNVTSAPANPEKV